MSIDAVLDENAQGVLRSLAAAGAAEGFYLAGGTGLALQLGHRRSLDLDFFQVSTHEKLAFRKVAADIDSIFGARRARLTLRQMDQASWDIGGTKVTFLAYPFRLLFPLVPAGSLFPDLGGVLLAAPKEIACMKAYAVGRRSTFRDYIDLYFLLKLGVVTLPEIVANAARKFVIESETVFSPKLFLEQLVYTEDVEDKDASAAMVTGGALTPPEVEAFLQEQVREFVDRETSPNQHEEGPGSR